MLDTAVVSVAEGGVEAAANPRASTFLRRLWGSTSGRVGLIIVAVVVAAAAIGPVVYSVSPTRIHSNARLLFVSARFPLGTDALGRDTLSRILSGARVSLLVGVAAVGIALVIGTAIGVAAAYYSGWVDLILMRVMDVFFAFPAILLALLVIAVLGAKAENVVIACLFVFTPSFARIARAPALEVMAQPYVELLKAVGVPGRRIMALHVLPNILAPIIVQASVTMSYAILAEASLSFLGLGIPPPQPSWGGMISDGETYLQTAPWVCLFPAAALFITIVGFNLFGDGLRDATDVRRG